MLYGSEHIPTPFLKRYQGASGGGFTEPTKCGYLCRYMGGFRAIAEYRHTGLIRLGRGSAYRKCDRELVSLLATIGDATDYSIWGLKNRTRSPPFKSRDPSRTTRRSTVPLPASARFRVEASRLRADHRRYHCFLPRIPVRTIETGNCEDHQDLERKSGVCFQTRRSSCVRCRELGTKLTRDFVTTAELPAQHVNNTRTP